MIHRKANEEEEEAEEGRYHKFSFSTRNQDTSSLNSLEKSFGRGGQGEDDLGMRKDQRFLSTHPR